jgi:hypothetical protein
MDINNELTLYKSWKQSRQVQTAPESNVEIIPTQPAAPLVSAEPPGTFGTDVLLTSAAPVAPVAQAAQCLELTIPRKLPRPSISSLPKGRDESTAASHNEKKAYASPCADKNVNKSVDDFERMLREHARGGHMNFEAAPPPRALDQKAPRARSLFF